MRDQTFVKRGFRLLILACIIAVFIILVIPSRRWNFFQNDARLSLGLPMPQWENTTHNNLKNILEWRRNKQFPGGTNFQNVQRVSPMSSWEERTLNDPNLTDIRSLPSSQRSDIIIKNRKHPYYVGDVVEVLLIVKDREGRRKTRGGDEVRIWSRGPGYTGSLGSVTDLGDGTYLGRVKIFWAGEITIKAGVFTPREAIAFLFRIVKTSTTQYVFTGRFGDDSNSETVRCTASRNFASQFTGICDLTEKNHGLPWYCARPKLAPCSEWRLQVLRPAVFPASDVEKQMIMSMTRRSSMNISISMTSKTRWDPASKLRNLPSSIPCNKLPPRLTWQERTPVGYAYKGTWLCSFCASDYSLSVTRTSQCLSGRRFWLLGDSTTRQLYTYLLQELHLQQITAEWTNPKSYNFSLAVDRKHNFSIAFSVHGLPFGYGGRAIKPSDLVATNAYIDSIPAGSKDIVLVHFYSHFQTMHPGVMRFTLRKTAESIQRLHRRSPEVVFLVKGPHVFQPKSVNVHVNDFWGNVVGDIFREEFEEMQDYVVYLDLWDLTAAVENIDIHPHHAVIKMIVNFVLSFICPSHMTPSL